MVGGGFVEATARSAGRADHGGARDQGRPTLRRNWPGLPRPAQRRRVDTRRAGRRTVLRALGPARARRSASRCPRRPAGWRRPWPPGPTCGFPRSAALPTAGHSVGRSSARSPSGRPGGPHRDRRRPADRLPATTRWRYDAPCRTRDGGPRRRMPVADSGGAGSEGGAAVRPTRAQPPGVVARLREHQPALRLGYDPVGYAPPSPSSLGTRSAAVDLIVSRPGFPHGRGSVSTTHTVPSTIPVESMSGAPR